MKNFSEFDKSFNLRKLSSYKLSIEVGYYGYSYCIIDTNRNQVVALSHLNFENNPNKENLYNNVEQTFKDDAYLNKKYKNVDIIYNTSKFSIIPKEFFDKKQLKSFFKFSHVLNKNENLHYNKLGNVEANNLFAMPLELTNYIENKFSVANFMHQGTPLIDYYLNENKNSKSVLPTFILNLSQNKTNIIVIKYNKLLFYNIFDYRNDDDVFYYLLNTINKLGYEANKIELILVGDIEGSGNLHTRLQKYITEIKFAVCNKQINYNITKIPEHFLANLIMNN